MNEAIEVDTRGLDQLIRALRGKLPTVQIGIFSDKNSRSGKNPSNASIGAIHEYGNSKYPQRSFLRVPISDNLQKYMENAGAFDEDALKKVVKLGNVQPWLEKVAIISEQIVMDGFSSGGFGKWTRWKTPGYENNTGDILVDTQQLRNSIGTKIK